MRRFTAVAFAVLVAAFAGTARSEVALPSVQVLGSVTNAARPVANALVIALNLKDLAATQTYSTPDGRFTLPPLPAGMYKIIAVKAGFVPAIATLIPTKANQSVKLALQDERHARRTRVDEMWEIRASLPPDVLRELDNVIGAPKEAMSDDLRLPRFRAQMVSLTGVGDQTTPSTFAQTSVGVQSRIGDNWQLGVNGDIHRIDDPSDGDRFGVPAAEASRMSMELRSSDTDSYRVASSKTFWRYRDAAPDAQADIRSHNFEWEHGAARVGVRYFAQDNLFTSYPFGSDLIEITGGTTLFQTRRNDLGVSLRVAQENVRNSDESSLRTANVNANGSIAVSSPLLLRYGVASRLGVQGTELAPSTGLEWKVGGNTSLVASGLVKVMNGGHTNALPMVVMVTGDDRILPRYAYSLGFVSGEENSTRFSAVASITAVESPLRVLLNEGFEQFWDGLYIDSGDVRRDVRLTFRKDLGRWVAVDVSTSAGSATPTHGVRNTKAKAYVTGDLQSIFLPTGTTLVVSYRGVQQPQENGAYRSERVNFRMAQPLHLPFDLKVLVGVDVARAENSPFLLDVIDTSNSTSKKYIGGLAMTF